VFEAQNELLAFRRLLQISGKFYSLLKVVPSVATLTHHLAQLVLRCGEELSVKTAAERCVILDHVL
jgi:hypothetical protein